MVIAALKCLYVNGLNEAGTACRQCQGVGKAVRPVGDFDYLFRTYSLGLAGGCDSRKKSMPCLWVVDRWLMAGRSLVDDREVKMQENAPGWHRIEKLF